MSLSNLSLDLSLSLSIYFPHVQPLMRSLRVAILAILLIAAASPSLSVQTNAKQSTH